MQKIIQINLDKLNQLINQFSSNWSSLSLNKTRNDKMLKTKSKPNDVIDSLLIKNQLFEIVLCHYKNYNFFFIKLELFHGNVIKLNLSNQDENDSSISFGLINGFV